MADLESLLQFLHIQWDPIPPWVKLSVEQMRKFAAVEVRLTAKLNQIQENAAREIAQVKAQKLEEFSKIVGVPMK